MPTRAQVHRGATVLALLLATLACTAEPVADTGLPLAFFHNDCAPWDGHALSLVLTHHDMADAIDVGHPMLRITSNRPPTSLAGSTVSWEGQAQDDGYATLCDSVESCTPANRVRVRFDRTQVGADRLAGEVEVELEDGRVIAGRFDAERILYEALCG